MVEGAPLSIPPPAEVYITLPTYKDLPALDEMWKRNELPVCGESPAGGFTVRLPRASATEYVEDNITPSVRRKFYLKGGDDGCVLLCCC